MGTSRFFFEGRCAGRTGAVFRGVAGPLGRRLGRSDRGTAGSAGAVSLGCPAVGPGAPPAEGETGRCKITVASGSGFSRLALGGTGPLALLLLLAPRMPSRENFLRIFRFCSSTDLRLQKGIPPGSRHRADDIWDKKVVIINIVLFHHG